MVGDDHHAVPGQELVEPAPAASTMSAQTVVGPLHRTHHVASAVAGGVGLVQVQEQEVEAVTGDEPPRDGTAVAIDARAEVPGRAREVGVEQVAEEVPPRPVDRIDDPDAAGNAARRGAGDLVPDAPAAHVQVDRRRDEPGLLERLEDRRGARGEVQQVQVDQDVVDHLARPLGEHRREQQPYSTKRPSPRWYHVIPGMREPTAARVTLASERIASSATSTFRSIAARFMAAA